MSLLDMPQIIQKVYDEPNNRLRVDTAATVVAGSVEVAVDDTTDSIKVGDGNGNYLAINPDGSLNVDINTTNVNTTNLISYNEITNVASGMESLITTYTAPSGKRSFLSLIGTAGTNIAEYRVYKNNIILDKQYTMFGTSLCSNFDYRNDNSAYPGINLAVGDLIEVKVIHNRPYNGNFNSKIQVTEIG